MPLFFSIYTFIQSDEEMTHLIVALLKVKNKDTTLSHFLSQKLGNNVDVLNFAVPGKFSRALQTLRCLCQYLPDMTVPMSSVFLTIYFRFVKDTHFENLCFWAMNIHI